MRIAVDARSAYECARRGVGNTLVALYTAMARVCPEWTFSMFYQEAPAGDPFVGQANIRGRRVDIKGDRFNFWQQVRLPVAAYASRAQVMHCHAGVAPRFPLVPLVATIHDLIPLETRADEPCVRIWGRNVRRAAYTARRILTGSEHSKAQIVRHFGVNPEKITVVHWGPHPHYSRVEDVALLAETRARYGLKIGWPYVLHFGMADPRKNTRHLLEAWSRLPGPLRTDYALLVVGVQGPMLNTFREFAASLGLERQAFVHGYTPEEDVPVLLSGATALCYPSLHEGFGLPVLDAFACGTAVLTSNSTSLPEVAGDAAVLVNPERTEDIRRGLHDLLTDDGLRLSLVARGRERLRQFSWERCAEQVASVLSAAARP
jgi:glycosyltransferase involved in cell wall biosynthesis